MLFFLAAMFYAGRMVSADTLSNVTWDGGGATNNWSEAGNWSGDLVPAAGDNVTFDATSTKNATIDVSDRCRFDPDLERLHLSGYAIERVVYSSEWLQRAYMFPSRGRNV